MTAAAGRAVTRLILPLTLLAAALALLVPVERGRRPLRPAAGGARAGHGARDPWSELTALRSRAATVTFLSVAPLVVLAAFAWALGQRSTQHA